MNLPLLFLLANVCSTWFMVGLIWFVQAVHYPQFALVGGGDSWTDYHRRHSRVTACVVGPPMIVELLSTIGLVVAKPTALPGWVVWAGMAMLGLVWASTAFLQVPKHGTLASGFSQQAHASLCTTNWVRTVAWSARGFLSVYATFLVAAR